MEKTNVNMLNSKIYYMACCAIFTALMCIFGPLSIPIGPVPVSLTNLVLYVSIFILGTKATVVSYVVYLLLGMVGLPVFSGYQGGLAKLSGPTGGYLIGFVFMIIVMGLAFEIFKGNIFATFAGMVVGTLIAYAFGTVWFVIMMHCEIGYALTVCVFPFIPFDIAKMVIAIALGKTVRVALMKANLIK